MIECLIDKKSLNEKAIITFVCKYPKEIMSFDTTLDMRKSILKENPLALKDIPKTLQSEEECWIALKGDCSVFPYISKKLLNEDLCLYAVKKDGLLLEYVPKKFRKENVLESALLQNGIALKFIDNVTYEFCKIAVTTNAQAFEYIPRELIDFELCKLSVEKFAESIQYIPVVFITKELVNIALKRNVRMIMHISSHFLTIDDYVNYLTYLLNNGESGFDVVRKLPHMSTKIKSDSRIIELLKKLKVTRFVDKHYDVESRCFIVTKHNGWHPVFEKLSFDSFEEFYNFLNGDIKDVNWNGFDFSNIDLEKYNVFQVENKNIEQDKIDDLDDNSFFEGCINKFPLVSLDNETECINVSHDNDLIINPLHNRKIYYISDLHLCHKIQDEFNGRATEKQINDYIYKIVEKMFYGLDIYWDDYLFIAGDISFSYTVNEMFLNCVYRRFRNGNIVVVLGNHELWEDEHLDYSLKKYRCLCEKMGITLLQNDLLVVNDNRFNSNGLNYKYRHFIVSYEQLFSMDKASVRNLLTNSQLCILGGTGFSGYCTEYNATNGIYKGAINTLEADVFESNKFLKMHDYLKDFSNSCNFVVLTHTPKDNWSNGEYVPNWIYVNGHTHNNKFCINKLNTFFSDNQIGYHNRQIQLKYFYISKCYDVFADFIDGKYEISRSDYLDFNRGKGIKCSCNLFDGKIIMLKKQGLYCFFYIDNNDELFLLSGGMKTNLEIQNINYYFDNMITYSKLVNESFESYYNSLKQISNIVKDIGGKGDIHGCIVDIDYYNHIYVNILDGTITPYYARNIKEKYIYKSVESLLLSRKQELYERYKALYLKEANLAQYNNLEAENDREGDFFSTVIYKPSKKVRQIQYLYESNIIRMWNNDILDNIKNKCIK